MEGCRYAGTKVEYAPVQRSAHRRMPTQPTSQGWPLTVRRGSSVMLWKPSTTCINAGPTFNYHSIGICNSRAANCACAARSCQRHPFSTERRSGEPEGRNDQSMNHCSTTQQLEWKPGQATTWPAIHLTEESPCPPRSHACTRPPRTSKRRSTHHPPTPRSMLAAATLGTQERRTPPNRSAPCPASIATVALGVAGF